MEASDSRHSYDIKKSRFLQSGQQLISTFNPNVQTFVHHRALNCAWTSLEFLNRRNIFVSRWVTLLQHDTEGAGSVCFLFSVFNGSQGQLRLRLVGGLFSRASVAQVVEWSSSDWNVAVSTPLHVDLEWRVSSVPIFDYFFCVNPTVIIVFHWSQIKCVCLHACTLKATLKP